MSDYFKRVQKMTQTRFWINNVTRSQATLALDAGAVGCTQNPSYTWKILNGSEDRNFAEDILSHIMEQESDPTEILIRLQKELISNIAKQFLPLFEKSRGRLGYVSIQGNPLQEDSESIIKYARINTEGLPNLMAKIPATENGLKAIKTLVQERIPINATECMSVRQVMDVCEIYTDEASRIANPAPLYFSLITGIFDEYLRKKVQEESIGISEEALMQAGLTLARKVHQLIAEKKYNCGFIIGGARGLHHFTDIIGANACITINWKGTADKLLELDYPVIPTFSLPTPYSIEDELVEKLDTFRKAYFMNAIKPDEYEDFGPVVLFRNGFIDNWNSALDYIKNFRR